MLNVSFCSDNCGFFLSQEDHFSNILGILIFACVSFSRYNFFPLAISHFSKSLQRLSKFLLSEQILF